MEKIVEIPEGVEARLENGELIVSGPKGELRREFRSPFVEMKIADGKISISSDDRRKNKALVGTWASHARNMITGVTKGYEARLKIVYSHFPIKFSVQGDKAVIQNFLGERNERTVRIKGNVKVELKKDEVVITGISKEEVGQAAADIENSARVTKFDRRVFQDGLHLIQKATPVEEKHD